MGLKYHLLLVGAVTTLAAGGCGSHDASTPPATAPSATSQSTSGLPAPCLDEATIGAVAGFPVHVARDTIKQSADAVNCTFLADDQAARPGWNVSILVAPESFADKAFADITDRAKRANTTTSTVPVGRDGIAYESPDASGAATVVGGKLIGVTMDGMGLSSPGDGRRVVVDLLGRVAATLGAPSHNAVVSQSGSSSMPVKTSRSAKPQASTQLSKPPAGKAAGALTFDPFDSISCTWVPRLFVDLSGNSKPGIALRVPLIASGVDRQVSVGVRAELNGPTSSKATASLTIGPDWRGNARLSLAPPSSGDTVSIAIQLDTGGQLAGTTQQNSWRTVQGLLPNPRPTSDQSFPCTTVV